MGRMTLLGAGAAASVVGGGSTVQYDWLGDTLGNSPANVDFTQWFETGTHTIESDAFGINNRHLEVNLAANSNQLAELTLAPAGAVPDIDIFYIASYPSADGTIPRNMGFVIMGSGDNANKNGYRIYFDGTNMVLSEYVTNSANTIATLAFPTVTSTAYGIRFRAIDNGANTILRARAWAWGGDGMAGEPGTWDIDTTDASLTAPGFCGPWSQRNNGVDYYHYIGIGLGSGIVAPGP